MIQSGVGTFEDLLAAWTLYKQLEEIAGECYTIDHNEHGTYININGEQRYCESSHPADITQTLQEIIEVLHHKDNPPSPPKRHWSDGPDLPTSSGGNGGGV